MSHIYSVIFIVRTEYYKTESQTEKSRSYLKQSNISFLFQTRMMNQKKLRSSVVMASNTAAVNPAIYSSSLDCLLQTVRTEGVTALYKGFIPTWVRLGPWNIIFFMTYEQMKKIY